MIKFRLFGFGESQETATPPSAEVENQQAPSSGGGTPGQPGGKRVLIVDDDPVFLRATAMKLQSAGFQVMTAKEGSEAIAALAFIMTGDPAAAIIGRKYGRHRFKTKSVEGSLAFLAAAMIIAFIVPNLPLMIGIIGALTATITEAVSFYIDDNTSVPLISGLIMQLVHAGMGM